MRAIVLSFGLGLLATAAFPDALITLTGSPQGSVAIYLNYPSPAAGIRTQFIAQSFTLASEATNIYITASLVTVGDASPGVVYLMNRVGPGTTVANQIATARFTFAHVSSYTEVADVPLFTGLHLLPGTYYLVYGGSPSSCGVSHAKPPAYRTAGGATVGSEMYSLSVTSAPVDVLFPPALAFDTVDSYGTFFTVTQGLACSHHFEWSNLKLPTSVEGQRLEQFLGNIPESDPTLYKNYIDSTLDDRVASLTSKYAQQNIGIHRLSGYRPADYQTHLYQLSVLYASIYAAGSEPDINTTCANEISQVMLEVTNHHLSHATINGIEIPGQLLVGMTSRHSALPANALDVAITPASSEANIRAALSSNGLYAPCHETSLHLQTTATCSGSVNVTATAFSPIATNSVRTSTTAGVGVPLRIIIRDASGRRIGYDASTGTALNEIGPTATYSGVNSDPQVITINDAADGDYHVEAVAIASGDYVLSISSDDTEGGATITSSSRAGHVVSGDTVEPLSLTSATTLPQTPARHRAVAH